MHYTPQEKYTARDTHLEPRRRPRLRRATSTAAAILAVCVAVAGCGSGPSTPGVATISTSTTTAASSSAGRGTQATGLLAYASCMRSHGITDFPDPSDSGGIDDKRAVVRALRGVSNAHAEAAQHDCRRLIPAGEGLNGKTSQPVSTQQQHYYLKAAACVRSHGVTNFPDPRFSDGNVNFDIPSSIDTHSTQFVQAAQSCAKLIPAGLPYSKPEG